MFKKAVVLGLTLSFLGMTAVKASEYDDCLKDFNSQKKEIGDFEYAICMKQEAARILKKIQKKYTLLANDSFYTKWNGGNGMFKGRIRDTYNAWLVYRNNYCDLLAEASKNAGGYEGYHRENCKINLGKEQLDALEGIVNAQLSDPE